nr:immunoglobulin heavy chain junction region [Macaca mulatta]
CARSGHGFDYW